MNRGNKLWHGSRIILPEHRAAIIEKSMEEERFFPRPQIDEDKLSEISQTIGEAMAEGRLITMQLYERFGPREVTMLPKKFDDVNRRLVGLSQLDEQQVRIPFEDIMDVFADF